MRDIDSKLLLRLENTERSLVRQRRLTLCLICACILIVASGQGTPREKHKSIVADRITCRELRVEQGRQFARLHVRAKTPELEVRGYRYRTIVAPTGISIADVEPDPPLVIVSLKPKSLYLHGKPEVRSKGEASRVMTLKSLSGENGGFEVRNADGSARLKAERVEDGLKFVMLGHHGSLEFRATKKGLSLELFDRTGRRVWHAP